MGVDDAFAIDDRNSSLRSMLRHCDLGDWSDRRRSDQGHVHAADLHRLVRT